MTTIGPFTPMRPEAARSPHIAAPRSAALSWTNLVWLGAVFIGLLVLWGSQLDGAVAEHDEAETLQLALNLHQHGTMSLAAEPPLVPSMLREPLPILTTAGSIALLDAVLGRGEAATYFSGPRAQWLRVQNVFWMAVLFAASFGILWSGTASFSLALIGAAIVGVLPVTPGVILRVDQLDTEVFASLLMLVACWLLATGFARNRMLLLVASGACFGLLTLVKAAMLYIFVAVVATLLVLRVLRPLRALISNPLPQLAVLALAFAVVVAPWMIRNYVHFGTPNISTRGGSVMMLRAVKNLMTPQEYLGSFYVWAPRPLSGAVGKVLGFSRQDLQRGGRLQRLNRAPSSDFAKDDLRAQQQGRPEDAISYYRKGGAELVKVREQLRAAGDAEPEEEADKIIQKRAESLILQHPWRHLALTVPFLWRGAAFAFPLLLLVIAQAAWRRQYQLAVFVWPAFGLVMFYALLTHFIPRYGSPALPLAIVGACLALGEWRKGVAAARLQPATEQHG